MLVEWRARHLLLVFHMLLLLPDHSLSVHQLEHALPLSVNKADLGLSILIGYSFL